MALICITGISGSGKTTVQAELVRRGYEAYGTDEGGLSSWRSRKTDELVEYPQKLEDRTHAWYAENSWILSRRKTEEIALQAKEKLIFLCGVPGNDGEVWDLFDKVICLALDNETLKQRIITRTSNEYGKAPDELEGILRMNNVYEKRYKFAGAAMIDATKPIRKLVDEILEIVKP